MAFRPAHRLGTLAALTLAVTALFLSPSSVQAAGRKRRPRATPTPAPPKPTPTPTPVPLLRAAGSCMKFVPGELMVVAEVGETGRVFRLDDDTVFTVKPRTGARVRLLYVDTPEGPLARKVMPGPEEAKPK